MAGAARQHASGKSTGDKFAESAWRWRTMRGVRSHCHLVAGGSTRPFGNGQRRRTESVAQRAGDSCTKCGAPVAVWIGQSRCSFEKGLEPFNVESDTE